MQRIKPDVKHIKLSDFPRTPWPVSFGLRPALQKTFNYCRQYPDKMESLKATLAFMQKKIAEWEASAQKVEFEGGSQKRPLVSGTFVTPALTTDTDGSLMKFNQPAVNQSDAIHADKVDPTASVHTSAQGAAVSEVPKVNRPVNTNPLKPQMPVQQAALLTSTQAEPVQQPTEPVEQVQVQEQAQVGNAYVPDLAAVLAQNAQQQ